MNKVYTRINWENYPSEATALNETNLNKMDLALDEVDNRLIEQDTTKLSKTDASNDVVNWTMNEDTGVITVTRRSGEQILFDLNIEKIPVSFSLSDDGILTMVTDDGTTFTADIGAMIPILTFNDSDEIAVSVSGEGINKTYSFSIKTNSITEDKLQPNFLADIKVQSANASLSASNAETNATKSQSYAVGGTGTRGENEDTDNAKYYNEQAQKALSEMQKSQVTGVKGNNETNFRTGNVNLTPANLGALATNGDSKSNTVTFTSNDVSDGNATSWTSVTALTSGITHATFFQRVSQMFKNVRYLYKMLGTTDISKIGDGTITGALSTLNSNYSKLGEVSQINLGGTVPVPPASFTAVCIAYNIQPGTYLLIGMMSDRKDIHYARLSRGNNVDDIIINAPYGSRSLVTVKTFTEITTIYLWVYQNAESPMNFEQNEASIISIRIK